MNKLIRRVVGLSIAIATAYLNWIAFAKIGTWIGSSDPEFFATALLLSVALHEIGHWIAMERHGVMAHIFFAVILGGAIPDMKYGVGKISKLNWNAQAEIMLAGVGMNILIIVGSIVLYSIGWIAADQMQKLVNMNASLTLINLLPYGMLDGGRFTKLLFDSIPEHLDVIHAKSISVVVATASIILIFFGTSDFALVGLLIFGLHRKAQNDDPHGSKNADAMTYVQCKKWTIAYTGLVLASVVALGLSIYIR